MGEPPQVILPLPASFEPTRQIRSTLLISSYAAVRDAGYGKAYLAALPVKHHAAILEAVAGAWVPIEVGVAHYDACSALGISHDQQMIIGRAVGEKVKGTLLGTVVRMAREVGVTPWTVIPQFQRFWNRAFDGGGLYAAKAGPKEVHIEVYKAPHADCAYWRAALCGLTMGVLDLFCQKAYMQERNPKKRAPGTAQFRIQWV